MRTRWKCPTSLLMKTQPKRIHLKIHLKLFSKQRLQQILMTMIQWISGQSIRTQNWFMSTTTSLSKSLIQTKQNLKFCFPQGYLFIFGFFLFQLGGCSLSKIYHNRMPSEQSMENISRFHIDRFEGHQSGFFREILIHELGKLPYVDYLEEYPNGSDGLTAIIDAEVKVISVREENLLKTDKNYEFVEHELIQEKSLGKREARKAFEFREIPLERRNFQRTLDLEIQFRFKSLETNEILKEMIEQVSFQQTYSDLEEDLEIPDPNQEMNRLAGLLMNRMLKKISPVTHQEIYELESGSEPLQWTFETLDLGHTGIQKGIRYATNKEYEQSKKAFYYVLYEPNSLEKKERFIFDDNAYIRLKRAKVPDSLMMQLLKLHGRSFKSEELDIIMGRLINSEESILYLGMIKSQTRENRGSDAVNLAAAHYNLGIVHQLMSEFDVASYHYAQANAHLPKDKYAQKWADTQISMGVYNPVESLTGLTISKAGDRKAPEQSMVRKKVKPIINFDGLDMIPSEVDMPSLKPVELPPLTKKLKPQDIGSAVPLSP